uniref:Rhodanese domain-containing protein n=1 Tax=Setaria digitata TaxID=48799 RepID=A0A915PYK4_9BILA
MPRIDRYLKSWTRDYATLTLTVFALCNRTMYIAKLQRYPFDNRFPHGLPEQTYRDQWLRVGRNAAKCTGAVDWVTSGSGGSFESLIVSWLCWTKALMNENRSLKDYRTTAIKEHSLSNEEVRRYSRQILVQEFGVQGQERLRATSLLIVGAGGLGCPVSLYCAGAGVGRIGVVDGDFISSDNLHRQIAYDENCVGHSKAESIKSSVKRYLINDACILAKKPLVSGSVVRWDGQLSVYGYGEDCPCYRCVFPSPPPMDAVISCSDDGVLGPNKLLAKTDRIDPHSFSELSKNSEKRLLLIDTRPSHEFSIGHLPNAINIPILKLCRSSSTDVTRELDADVNEMRDKGVYVICRRGEDSQKAVLYLRKEFADSLISFKDIDGGYEMWSHTVDKNFPVY